MSKNCLQIDVTQEPAIPLSDWASDQIARLARTTGSAKIARLNGATLLGERAVLNGFTIPGLVSAGGGCRLFKAMDGWVALNLSRPDDRELLPALFSVSNLNFQNDTAVAALILQWERLSLVERGREMGLAIAADREAPPGPAVHIVEEGLSLPHKKQTPLVVDLSGLWAGPLAGHLLWLQGAKVVKVESRNRPDMMRNGDPGLFTLLNQGKDSVTVDLRTDEDRQALIRLLERADIVIEAARPRGLLQLGIDAAKIARKSPGLVWITITGHGANGDAANWVGFGDDCAVAGGLSTALHEASGKMGFVGDAIADPLTGITAACVAFERWKTGRGARIILSMSGIVDEALTAEKNHDPLAFDNSLKLWSQSVGLPFPTVDIRPKDAAHPLGSDTAAWLGGTL